MADQRTTDKQERPEPLGQGTLPDLQRRLRLARLVLWWERAWRLGWPLPALLATFAAVSLFDVLPLLPGWLHAAILALLVLPGLVVLWRLRRLSWPDLQEAQRRLERDSGFSHRPLQGLADHLAAGTRDPVSQALWAAERLRLAALLKRLSLKQPAPDLARHDPIGLRFAPLLLLAIALSGGWHDWPARLSRALHPDISRLAGPSPVLQVWLTPPAYTGKAPILLNGPSPHPVTLPADTHLLAVLQGGKGKAQLFLNTTSQAFQSLDGDSQRLETGITGSGRLLIRQGRRVIGDWTVAVAAIEPPTIAFASPPEADRQGRLRLDVEGRDAYGIARAWATIRRSDTPATPALTIELPLGAAHPTDLRQAGWHDLTGNPWAGLPVSIEPGAENVAGRKATGEAVTTILPERTFTNPIARAIVAERRKLIATPDQRQNVAEALAAIASRPDSFGNDLIVYLNLSTSVSRLIHDPSAGAIPSVTDILWQVALRVEDGDKPAAQQALDDAARALEKALAEGAPQAEIERLMNELRTTMSRYFDALAEQAMRQGLSPQLDNPDRPGVSPEELAGMLDQMRDLSRTGSADAARQLLSELRQMLDGLGAAMDGTASSQDAREAQQTMKELQDVIAQQRKLLDDTFRRAQQDPKSHGQPEAGGGRRSGAEAQRQAERPQDGLSQTEAERQNALRKRLDRLAQSLERLGANVPDTLGQAGQAMDDSTLSLRRNELDDAVDSQSEALARLQEGGRAAAQALARQMRSGITRQGQGSGRDPLGRPLQGRGEGEDHTVKIPEQAATQKAREVLDELRRRAGQAERPAVERDYLQRLLKQFF